MFDNLSFVSNLKPGDWFDYYYDGRIMTVQVTEMQTIFPSSLMCKIDVRYQDGSTDRDQVAEICKMFPKNYSIIKELSEKTQENFQDFVGIL
jgi:hypothetical protein